MKRRMILLAVAITASGTLSAQSRFSASDVRGVGLRHEGKVTVRNDGRRIEAVARTSEGIERVLVSLRSSSSLRYRPYGAVLYESDAAIRGRVAERYGPFIREAASSHGIDPRLIVAVAARESAGDPHAVSRVGAVGLMQLMPETARYLGVTNAFDARENILAGTHYLRMLLDTFRGDLDLTLAAYNAGPGAVQRYRGIPPYRETVAYVAAVRGAYERDLKR